MKAGNKGQTLMQSNAEKLPGINERKAHREDRIADGCATGSNRNIIDKVTDFHRYH